MSSGGVASQPANPFTGGPVANGLCRTFLTRVSLRRPYSIPIQQLRGARDRQKIISRCGEQIVAATIKDWKSEIRRTLYHPRLELPFQRGGIRQESHNSNVGNGEILEDRMLDVSDISRFSTNNFAQPGSRVWICG